MSGVETHYCLMVDFVSVVGGPGAILDDLHVTTEVEALKRAQNYLSHSGVYRVEVFKREVVAEWEKVEELRRERESVPAPSREERG